MRAVFALLLLAAAGAAQAQPTPVTVWTDEADSLGNGNANFHSLAIMHQAMHDALNAAAPVYARWAPADADEPRADGANPAAAMAAAAAATLEGLHPDRRASTEALLANELALLPPGPERDRGQTLGAAIGRAAVARRADDGFARVRLFRGSDVPGVWRPTPPDYQTSGTTSTRPFLFGSSADVPGAPPPEPGSPRYLADVEQTRSIGSVTSASRTALQSDAATFWAYQSTQRGYIHLAATLIDMDRNRFTLAEQARIMAQFAAAMADSAILVWNAKESWAFWRPIDAIRSGAFGVAPDPAWQPFIVTPPHPEYPSGHAADCYVGAGFVEAVFLRDKPTTYTAQSPPATLGRAAVVWSTDMGAAPAPVELLPTPRQFPTIAAAAQECADSRIWAGVHFPSANAESRRIAGIIVGHALEAVPAR